MFARRLRLSFLASLLLLPAALSAAAPSMKLVGAPRTLGPATTIEVAFSEPIVASDAVGKIDETPPVTVVPAAPFTFTWLDQRRGVLQPTAALPLATTFQITVREGLKTVAGAAFEEDWSATVATPAMEYMSGKMVQYFAREDAPVLPVFTLLFNMNVSPETAAPFLKFTDGRGATVAAAVEQKDEEYSSRHYRGGSYDPRTLAPWDELFRLTT
ncbi:MAG: hypothetical protein EOO11_21385, partial [Chitinophagaceae bacterium]